MPNKRTTFDDHNPLAFKTLQILEEFIDEIGDRGCISHFDKVIDGQYYLKGKHLTQKPERFIEDHLVFPMLRRAFGYSLRPQPKQYAPRWPKSSGVPDFCITSIPISIATANSFRFFGEVKAPKKIESAQNDMADYLNSDLDIHALAILTDGFTWELWVRPKGEETTDLENPYAKTSLWDSLKTVRTRNLSTAPYQPHKVRKNIDTDTLSEFTLDSVFNTIESKLNIDITEP